MSAAKHTPGTWFAREWNTHDKTTVLVDAPDSFLKVRQIAECEEEADARLIAAAPDLLDEHQQWADWLGEAFALALQGDYSKVDGLARTFRIGFPSGAPVIKSDAIAKATGGTA